MTLEALNIDLPSNGDSAELSAYKQRVRDVAGRYANKHNWCSVIEDIYAELDIPKSVSTMTVTFEAHGYILSVAVSPYDLSGKTALQQAKVLVDRIGGELQVKTPRGIVIGSIALVPEDVTAMRLPMGALDGIVWRYAAETGRVLHAWDMTTSARYGMYSKCTRAYQYPNDLLEHTPRGSGNQCRACVKALNK